MAFYLPYIYDYITKLCVQQAEVVQIHGNDHAQSTERGKANHKEILIGLNLAD
jgi:hypothetical protein